MGISSGGREKILARIRNAQVVSDPAIDDMQVNASKIFPPIENVLDRFVAECTGNLTQVARTANAAESLKALANTLQAVPAGVVWVQDARRLRELASAFAGRAVMWSSEGRAPEDCVATVTLCEGLVAQTGSIVSSSLCGGRGGSIIAPVHIVYASEDQLVADIPAALRSALNGKSAGASYVGLITGSSRTADIEKILVQGAHGPVKVVLILESR